MRLIDADALIPTQVHTVVVLKDGREQLESVLYAEQVDDAPTVEPASPWHRVEEPPKKTAKYLVWVDVNNGVFAAYPELRTAAYNVVRERWYVDGDQRTEWIGTPRYWMPIEPPKEEV